MAKKVVKIVEKRMRRRNRKIQYLALGVLEAMVKSCGDFIHDRIAATSILPEMLKIAKENRESQAREKVFLLLDSWKEAFGGPCGRYPQYFTVYDELQHSGIVFPRRSDTSDSVVAESQAHPIAAPQCGIEQCHTTEVQVSPVVDATLSMKVNATSDDHNFKVSDDYAKVYLVGVINVMMYGSIRFRSNDSSLKAIVKIMQALPTTEVAIYVEDVLLTVKRLLRYRKVYNMDTLWVLIECILNADETPGKTMMDIIAVVGAAEMMRMVVFNSSGRRKELIFQMLICILGIDPEVAFPAIKGSYFKKKTNFVQKTFLLQLLEIVIQRTGSKDVVDDLVAILSESCECSCNSCQLGSIDHKWIPIKIIKKMAEELIGTDQESNLEQLFASMWMNNRHPSNEIWGDLISTIRALNLALGKKRLLWYFMMDLTDIGSPNNRKVWEIYNAVFHYGENCSK